MAIPIWVKFIVFRYQIRLGTLLWALSTIASGRNGLSLHLQDTYYLWSRLPTSWCVKMKTIELLLVLCLSHWFSWSRSFTIWTARIFPSFLKTTCLSLWNSSSTIWSIIINTWIVGYVYGIRWLSRNYTHDSWCQKQDEEEAGALEKIKTSICEVLELYTQKYEEDFPQLVDFFSIVVELLANLGPEPKHDTVSVHEILSEWVVN